MCRDVYSPRQYGPIGSGRGRQRADRAVGKVFISYSHDSPEHSERVLALSDRLRELGVDVELDRYHMRPPQGWPQWCTEQLRPEVSGYVLVICTPTYRARVEYRSRTHEGRGVYWEGAKLYNYLLLRRRGPFAVLSGLAYRTRGMGWVKGVG